MKLMLLALIVAGLPPLTLGHLEKLHQPA